MKNEAYRSGVFYARPIWRTYWRAKLRMLLRQFPIAVILLLALPHSAFAATHHYTCSDFDNYLSASCTGDVFNTGSAGQIYNSNSPTTGNLTTGTWYVSATVTGGSFDAPCYSYACAGEPPATLSGVSSDLVEVPLTATSRTELYFFGSGAIVSNLCIDDDSTSCTSAPPTPPLTGTSIPLFAGEAAGTVVLWTIVFVFVVWLVLLFT